MDQNSYLPVPDSPASDTGAGTQASEVPELNVPQIAPPLDPVLPTNSTALPQAPTGPVAGSGNDPFMVTPKLAQQLSSVPPEANDVDIIEKEWVNHLKEIAARTADNPFIQQQEISRAKADYLKKRYNKDIKVSEGK